jgi:penicillin V acylase-like amidase (Ntn superfamily)
MKIKLKTLPIHIIAALALYQNTNACTTFSIKTNEKNPTVIVGRSLDFTMNTGNKFVKGSIGDKNNQNLYYTPDDDPISPYKRLGWKNKYEFMGQSVMNSSRIVDGFNDQGLYAAYLYLGTTGSYPKYSSKSPHKVIGISNLVNYILGTQKSVSSALDAVKNLQVINSGFPMLTMSSDNQETTTYYAFPLHVSLRDNNGNYGVIEFIDGNTNLYCNGIAYADSCKSSTSSNTLTNSPPTNVLTNSPNYDWQMNINWPRYKDITPGNSDATIGPKSVCQDSSSYAPLPSDWTSTSRFIRVSKLLQSFPTPNNKNQAISLADLALASAQEPLGASPEATIWKSIVDLTDGIYYFKEMYTIVPNKGKTEEDAYSNRQHRQQSIANVEPQEYGYDNSVDNSVMYTYKTTQANSPLSWSSHTIQDTAGIDAKIPGKNEHKASNQSVNLLTNKTPCNQELSSSFED